ncbi:chemotaxis protein CheD [Dactylosporangium sucinum]|uniref:Probable chemoreceptor glutamine deamidase CheD n=1 Tax=Dactylosporangium sucinum TaxID=1424081 RepID=A0A917WUV5_9ACTN|nr:chemotaxis protein CheD [Dactylosporangium sucinum]GGM30856.1 putative chemoreceptor glutamine deamidase CheD [Dactylosporangium sucinum]
MADVFLYPGGFHFAGAGTRIATLLGSCVAVTLWHPGRRVGGMCHYMLPGRGGGFDGRYAGDAFALFMGELARTGTEPAQYHAKLFGGGAQLFTDRAAAVGPANVEAGLRLLDGHGFAVVARHLGGTGVRRLRFDLATGDVWLQHTERADMDAVS